MTNRKRQLTKQPLNKKHNLQKKKKILISDLLKYFNFIKRF